MLPDAALPRKLPWRITTRTESRLTEARGAFMAEETYQQTLYLGDRIEDYLASVSLADVISGRLRTKAAA